MKGTILDFLKLAAEKPELTQELVALAAKHDFEFTDEVSDEELEAVAGGASVLAQRAARLAGFTRAAKSAVEPSQPALPSDENDGADSSALDNMQEFLDGLSPSK